MAASIQTANPPDQAKPALAVTLGDPGGIGPEVIVKALADQSVRRLARWRVLGIESALEEAAAGAGIKPFWKSTPFTPDALDKTDTQTDDVVLLDYEPDGPTDFAREADRRGGQLSFRFVIDAISMALGRSHGAIAGVVTGPISKQAWRLAGHGKYPGHTELFAARCEATRYGMMFVTPRLRVILATAHIPLAQVNTHLTAQRISEVIELGHEACRRFGIERPRIAVCGLNPHAGEGGMLGREDLEVIGPAIESARNRGIDARGPFPGDTIFNAAVNGAWDLVVAMYHDQGLIPVKLLDRDRAVNVTVGLPIIRTSPDHGTAFDIAGRNQADPGSMKAAMELAAQLGAA